MWQKAYEEDGLICQIGPGKGYPGGMKAVIDKYMKSEELKCFSQKHIVTASKKNKIIIFAIGICEFTLLCIRKKVALAHIHMSEGGSCWRTRVILQICSLFNVPAIVHSHGGRIQEYYHALAEKGRKKFGDAMKKANKIIVLTDGHIPFWRNIVPENKIVVVPNSVKRPNNLDKRYFKNGKLNVLFLGFLSKEKGIYDLINAIELIKNEGNNDIDLQIGGNGEIQQVGELVKEKKLDSIINVHGWMNEKEKENALKESDLLVLPSHYESFGIVIIEAMAHKLPVICGDKGFTKEIVTNKKDGLIAESGNPIDLKNKIKFFIENKSQVGLFGKAGYQKVIEKYCDDSILIRLRDLYYGIIRDSKGHMAI